MSADRLALPPAAPAPDVGARHLEDGFATVQYVVATAFGLVMLVMVANLLVDLYARGAVREAIDEATRAATRVDAPPGTCEERARDALDSLLRGPAGDHVVVTCGEGPDWVTASAEVTLASWIPWLVPDWSFTVSAVAAREK